MGTAAHLLPSLRHAHPAGQLPQDRFTVLLTRYLSSAMRSPRQAMCSQLPHTCRAGGAGGAERQGLRWLEHGGTRCWRLCIACR